MCGRRGEFMGRGGGGGDCGVEGGAGCVWPQHVACGQRKRRGGESQPESHSRAKDNVVVGGGGGEGEWGGECVVCGVWRVACGVWGRGVRAGMRVVSRVHVWLWVSRGAGVAQRHS